MDNSKRLTAWRSKNKLDGVRNERVTASDAEKPGATEPTEETYESERSKRLGDERRRTEDLLPTDEDLAARRAQNAADAYSKGRARLLRITSFLLLPLLIALVYMSAFAPHYYRSDSTFTVVSAVENGDAPAGGMVALGGTSFTDGYRVKQYLLSAEALAELDRKENFLSHFGGVEPSAALDFYRDRVRITVDQQQKLVLMRVDAKSGPDSVRFANALLVLAQEKIRSISEQIDRDQLAALQEEEKQAKSRLGSALEHLQSVQVARLEIDPRKSAESIFTIINQLETDLSEQEALRAALLANDLDGSPLLPRINARIEALRSQIERQESRLIAASTNNTVQRSIALYDAALAEKEVAEAGLQTARETLDRARLRGLDHRKYLIVVARPIPSIAPESPRLFYVLFGISVLLMAYILARLWWLRRSYPVHV